MNTAHPILHRGLDALRLAAQPNRRFRRAELASYEPHATRSTGASSRISRPTDLFAEFQRY